MGGKAIGLDRREVDANLVGEGCLKFFDGLLDFLSATVLWLGWRRVLDRNRCPPIPKAQRVGACRGTGAKQTGNDG